MGHLADLEIAMAYLRKQGIKTEMFGKLGEHLMCKIGSVILTDRKIVELHQAGELDVTGISNSEKVDTNRL